jgi:magnesium-transporting ATPase (P-type)
MEEALEAVELAADAGLEGVVSWLFRLVGVVLVLAGLGLWLVGNANLLWLPAVLVAAGLLLVLVPEVLFTAVELFA